MRPQPLIAGIDVPLSATLLLMFYGV